MKFLLLALLLYFVAFSKSFYMTLDDVSSIELSDNEIQIGDEFSITCSLRQTMMAVKILKDDEEVYSINRKGITADEDMFDVDSEDDAEDGSHDVLPLSPPFEIGVTSLPATKDMEGSYKCVGIGLKLDVASCWQAMMSSFAFHSCSKVVRYISDTRTLSVVGSNKPLPFNVPDEPLMPAANGRNRKDRAQIAVGTLKSPDYSLDVDASSLCAKHCELSNAMDNNKSTVFSTKCSGNQSDIFWMTIELERQFKDLRVEITPANIGLTGLFVGGFNSSDKKMASLCAFNSYQYFCENKEPMDGIIIYRKACLKFKELVIYTGHVEAPDHCRKDSKTDAKQFTYRGFISKTKSKKKCLEWDEDDYPSYDDNYCRNSEDDKKDTIWCYFGEEEKEWEYCNSAPDCGPNFQIKVI